MSDLVHQLAAKEPHYVRCIKPNEIKSSTAFDAEGVGHQVATLLLGWSGKPKGKQTLPARPTITERTESIITIVE